MEMCCSEKGRFRRWYQEGVPGEYTSRGRISAVNDRWEHESWISLQKLSKKYHPDINPDEAAHEKFIQVSKGQTIWLMYTHVLGLTVIVYSVWGPVKLWDKNDLWQTWRAGFEATWSSKVWRKPRSVCQILWRRLVFIRFAIGRGLVRSGVNEVMGWGGAIDALYCGGRFTDLGIRRCCTRAERSWIDHECWGFLGGPVHRQNVGGTFSLKEAFWNNC